MANLNARISFPAAMLADPVRETMVMALMDGRAYTSKELAYRARITPQTASFHLKKLVESQILICHRQGRGAYYRLNGAEVAAAIEALSRIAPSPNVPSHVGRQARPLRYARRCYDHLAGRLGVEVAKRVEWLGLVVAHGLDYDLTAEGHGFFADMGMDISGLRDRRRSFLRPCVDWTERKPHLAGSLGAALLDHYVAEDWLRPGTQSRQLLLTDLGRRMFRERFGLSGESLEPIA
jgi:DNA-binding transcriptional ArsR family regulator